MSGHTAEIGNAHRGGSLLSALSNKGYLLATLLFACLATYPLLAEPGLLNTRGGGDSPFLLQRLHQLETAVRDGHFPVRWMPDANYGYGYPFYNFYAPLSIYITLLFRLIGFGYVGAIQLSQLLGFLVAAWGMFQLGKRWWGHEAAGFLTAVAYTLAPFHMVNIYTRGDSLAEFWAMAFYPLVILTADNLWQTSLNSDKQNKTSATLHFALAYAALILSHNISALIFTPFLGLFLLLRSRPFAPLTLLRLLPALLLALALAAWFFLPALAEQSLAQLQPVTEGYFHYSNHFRSHDLSQSSFFFDYNPDGGHAFRMGLMQSLLVALALLLIGLRGRLLVAIAPAQRPLAPLLLTALIATFMITPASRLLWDHLPLLPFTQFPWRFLSVQAFGIALLIGVLGLLPWRRWWVAATAVLLLTSSLGNLRTDHLALADSDITAERLAQYEWFTGNIGSTVSAEYLPPTVQPRPVTSQWLNSGQRWQLTAVNPQSAITAHLTQQRTTYQSWQIETAVATDIIFPTLHWPGWQASLNSQPTASQPAPGSGLIQLSLPAGSHTVELRLARTPIRLIAELISLAALLITIILAWRAKQFALPTRRAWPLLLPILPILILNLWPAPASPADNLTWDFAQMGYLQHGPVAFSNGGLLPSYGYSSETAVANQPFTLNLNWQGNSSQVTISLHTPAIHRYRAAPALATLTQTVQPGGNDFHFSLPANIPAGLVVPQIIVENGRPLLPQSQGSRGNLFLRPFYVHNSSPTDEPTPQQLEVRPLHIKQQGNSILAQLAWFTPQPLSPNYSLSLRLVDINGIEQSQFDTQPGYGFLPSSSWQPGQWQHDWLAMPLPDGFALANSALVLRLYGEQVVLTRRLGQFDEQAIFQANQPSFTLPVGIEPATAVFGDVIQLQGYQLEQTADTLHLTLYWQALSGSQRDYTRFVHLAMADGQPLSQADGAPGHNSYPTSQWTANEIISDSLNLPLSALPPGDYQLLVGFYEPVDGFPRLTAVSATNSPLPNNSAPLTTLTIEE